MGSSSKALMGNWSTGGRQSEALCQWAATAIIIAKGGQQVSVHSADNADKVISERPSTEYDRRYIGLETGAQNHFSVLCLVPRACMGAILPGVAFATFPQLIELRIKRERPEDVRTVTRQEVHPCFCMTSVLAQLGSNGTPASAPQRVNLHGLDDSRVRQVADASVLCLILHIEGLVLHAFAPQYDPP